jgi:hypothetical protein
VNFLEKIYSFFNNKKEERKMKKYFKLILLLGISLIFLTGCAVDLVTPENDVNSPATEGSAIDENPAGVSGTGKGTLKIYLTDAPGDFLQLNIIVSRIEGHIENEGEEGYWEDLASWDDGLPVDLLTLQGVSLLLGSSELPANHYTQLRVFLKEEAILVLEGPEGGEVTETLKIPSSQNTGIKLNRPFDIVDGGITILTLDFDAQKSVIQTGNGNYKMKPVIHLVSETYSAEELPEVFGSVYGNVSYESTGIGGANIELAGGAYIFANTTTTSEEVGSEGNFSIANVPAGTYTLNVVADGYYNYSVIDVVVTAGADTEVLVELLPIRGISGIVVSSLDQSVIVEANVSVELDSVITSTVTDTEGIFSIEQLPVGIYDLTITADNYVPYISPTGIEVPIVGGITDIGTIELDPL